MHGFGKNPQQRSYCSLPFLPSEIISSIPSFLAADGLNKSFKVSSGALRLWGTQAALFSTVYINICWITDWENNIWRKHFPLKVVGTSSSSVFRSIACQSGAFFLFFLSSGFWLSLYRDESENMEKRKTLHPTTCLAPLVDEWPLSPPFQRAVRLDCW